ncbi:tRNA (adenosine(37)-N6)-dimethylallyltransferase MiaA [Anseongella ginsenosidimutans]|nr:tRNA (adenosine(37)-N6)-dimethylallyltransferase MiaA [Anseongella ginsenosidimutans]
MRLLTVLGPTASGKTRLAVALANKINGAVISADSRQVFRGMDIGTGKDLDEYGSVPNYLIDIKEAGEEYHVAAFREDFLCALDQVNASGKVPVLCGGTGLYIQAALQGLPYAQVPIDPELRRSLETKDKDELLSEFREQPSEYSPLADTSTRKRLIRAIEISRYLRQNEFQAVKSPASDPFLSDPLIIGIRLPVEIRRARITERLHQRLGAGLLDEVRSLLARGVPAEKLLFYGLEYKFAVQHLQGELSYPEMVNRLNTAIHQFAKRQMTFFRKLEKDGLAINWIDGTLPVEQQVEAGMAIIQTIR